MRLLFSGSIGCDEATFKRLLVIGDEIAFMDRPSVTFRNWGTVGAPSPFRRYDLSDKEAVRVSVYAPPSGRATELYRRYIEVDLASLEFRGVFLEGLEKSPQFVSKFIQLDGNYVVIDKGETVKGAEIRKALLQDVELRTVPLEGPLDEAAHWNDLSNSLGRRETLRNELINASIKVTNSMVVSEQSGCVPASDDPYFTRLLALRMSLGTYLGGTSRLAPLLGLEVARSVIPDKMLEKVGIEDILQYRRKSRDVYRAWSIELDRLTALLDEIDLSDAERKIQGLIKTEVQPRLLEYENEMKSIRDQLFGSLIKEITKWEIPTLSIAYLSNLSTAGAIVAFVGALTPSIPHIVDYIQARRGVKRKHGLAYLIDIKKKAKQ
jgi:hypothetical protein